MSRSAAAATILLTLVLSQLAGAQCGVTQTCVSRLTMSSQVTGLSAIPGTATITVVRSSGFSGAVDVTINNNGGGGFTCNGPIAPGGCEVPAGSDTINVNIYAANVSQSQSVVLGTWSRFLPSAALPATPKEATAPQRRRNPASQRGAV